jgi:hypothetical protein
VVVVAGAVAAVLVAVAPRPAPPLTEPPIVPLPTPVQANVGVPFAVSGLNVTVQAATTAAPPPALGATASDRLVVLFVGCSTGGRQSAVVSPYDWVLTSAGGTVAYQSVVDGIDGVLPQTTLEPGQAVQGRVAFLVPATAKGLRLHFLAEVGDGSADVALSPGL